MFVSYLLIRALTFPFSLLSYSMIHSLGKSLGTLAYYFIPKYRKRAISNLALASDLELSNEQIYRVAKKSIQSLMITVLEYAKLARETNIAKIASCVNPEIADHVIKEGKGVIFFCGHQANWELLFLEGTNRMSGVAIGRPIKNKYLYGWVQSIRQKFGGTIVPPQKAIKEGLRALKKGKFLGIVGDQGMPGSGFTSSFLGRKAFTSPMPALLSYKTGTPIIVATTVREKAHYFIHYSDPLYPNQKAPMDEEVHRLMKSALKIYEDSIKEKPDQWLWIHNRWKQQLPGHIKHPYRQDSLAIFLPEDPELINQIPQIRTLYPTEHITLFLPESIKALQDIEAEIKVYKSPEDMLLNDLRFKLVINFTDDLRINKHYKKSAISTLSPKTYQEFESSVKNA